MPITRAQADAILIARDGKLLSLVGLDGTTADGTNPALVDPLREGLASLGLVPASFSAVTDADLSAVADRDVSQLVDVAELVLVRGVSSSFTDVDETISMGSIRNSQNRSAIEDRWKGLAAFVKEKYGYGLGPLGVGSMDLGMNARRRPGWPGDGCWGDF